MHHCLRVDEIVRAIAQEIVVADRHRTYPTAVAFACCCKSFEDPVLDTLWEAKRYLYQLLGTLPSDVYRHPYKVSTTIAKSVPCLLNDLV